VLIFVWLGRLILVICTWLAFAFPLLATETDQFTTPPTPLRDIGPELSRKIVEIIESDPTGRDPERVLSRWVGRNMVASRLVRWVRAMPVSGSPDRYLPPLTGSIYRRVRSPVPRGFRYNAPTVLVHGYYMGTDKIDHFFQQGHDYYARVSRIEAAGGGTPEAIAAAVARGVRQEHKWFGTLASGVYSNGDLAANYAGMKFYLNLRRPVRIGDRVMPPLLIRTPEGWRLRPGVDPDRLIEPFLSNHLDESLNPSRYRYGRDTIRFHVRARCMRWAQFYADRLDLVAAAGASFATAWFGEDYGHWLPPVQEISIATECGPVHLLAQNPDMAESF
jgi:hypothetical protein